MQAATTFSAAIETSEKAMQKISSKKGVEISFKNLNYSVVVNHKKRQILNNLNGVCQSGTVTAILGASGGGKTSLLNVLSRKISPTGTGMSQVSGEIQANGNSFSNEDFNKFSAYVMQDDILVETFTVRECVKFAADMKLGGTEQEKEEKVEEMLGIMGLSRCANALIGGKLNKGISGGERKRANIACELITNPAVLFLDEPTSGLDSFTAFTCISTLQTFAKTHNKTVIMSIHSPNTDIWNLFDNIILLVQGNIIFQGHRVQAVNHFASIGFQCPTTLCPADYLMHHMTSNEQNHQILPTFLDGYNEKLLPAIMNKLEEIENSSDKSFAEFTQKGHVTSFAYQVKRIAQRTLLQAKRDPMLLRARVIQTAIIAFFVAIVYVELPSLKESTSRRDLIDRNSLLFLNTMSMLLKSMSGVLLTFPSEREVYLKEYNSKYYSAHAYVIGRLLLEFVQITIYPIINTVIIYFITGLNTHESQNFFYYLLILIALSYCGNALGLLAANIFTDRITAAAVQPLLSQPFILFSGFYKNKETYASWIAWLQYLSPLTFSTEGAVINEYEGTTFTVYDPLEENGYKNNKWSCLVYIACLFFFYQALAFIIFFKKRPVLQ